MNSSRGISVVICCHNSAGRITSTLNHLANQQPHEGFAYEIVLVDNNCSDNTVDAAVQHWNLLNATFPLHVVKQSKPGLSHAREKGIESAIYEYIILCDDDNWLCSDYLKRAIGLFESFPGVAILGGVGEPEFEGSAPLWFNQLNGFGYAIGSEGRYSGMVDSVYGAGMGLRKSVFLQLINGSNSLILTDRKGNSLSSGGDAEICLIFKRAGYSIYMDTGLRFKHFLSAGRLNWNYYLKLRKAFGVANAYLQVYNESFKLDAPSGLFDYTKRRLLYFAFLCKRFHYFLFPGVFKTGACAAFIQTLSMKRTLFKESKYLLLLSREIKPAINLVKQSLN